MRPKRDDVGDLTRLSAIWTAAVTWIAAGYALQEPAHDAYDTAVRTIFTYAMAIVIPGVSLAFAVAWVVALRRRRR